MARKGVKFHVLSKSGCPYCMFARGAMMMYFKADTLEKVARHAIFYEDADEFYNVVGEDVVPESYVWVPRIVEESEGKMKFIGGLSHFVKKYS